MIVPKAPAPDAKGQLEGRKKIYDVSTRVKVNKAVARLVVLPRISFSNQSNQTAKSRVRTAKGIAQDRIVQPLRLL